MKERIRFATKEDAQDILEIYGKYILETSISFEVEVPTVTAFQQRMEGIMATHPYVVYEVEGKVVGYAYATKHGERAAFCYDVDLSVYFSPDYHSQGKATMLYHLLFELLLAQGFYNAYASYTEPNEKSRLFHEKLGFHHIGTFSKAGYKLGGWRDLTWMGMDLQEYTPDPQAVLGISQLSPSFLEETLGKYNI